MSVIGLAYWFLDMRMESYKFFWMIFMAINLMFFLFLLNLLPETMPKEQKKPFAYKNLNPLLYYWRAIALIFRYPIMVGLCLMVFTVNFGLAALDIAYNQLLLGELQYDTASALFIALAGYPTALIGNGLASIAIPRYGAWRCWFVGMFFVTLGFVVYGLWTVYFLQAGNLQVARLGPIVGGSIISTFAGCFSTPAYQVIVSKSVQPHEQATAQSMISLVVRLAYVVGSPFYTLVVYQIGATGHRAVLYVYICAGMMALSALIMAVTLLCLKCTCCGCDDQGWEVAARKHRVSIGTGVAAAAANGTTTIPTGGTTSATKPLFVSGAGGGSGGELCKAAAEAKSPHGSAARSHRTSDGRPELHQ